MVRTLAEHEVGVGLLDFVVDLEGGGVLQGSQLAPVDVMEEFVVLDFTDTFGAESEGRVLTGAVADELFALFGDTLHLVLELDVLLEDLAEDGLGVAGVVVEGGHAEE